MSFAKQYHGPVFGGRKDGQSLSSKQPTLMVPKPASMSSLAYYRVETDKPATVLRLDVEVYHYSRHGFWYEAGLGEDAARQRFCDRDYVIGVADDDA